MNDCEGIKSQQEKKKVNSGSFMTILLSCRTDFNNIYIYNTIMKDFTLLKASSAIR